MGNPGQPEANEPVKRTTSAVSDALAALVARGERRQRRTVRGLAAPGALHTPVLDAVARDQVGRAAADAEHLRGPRQRFGHA